MGFLKSPEEKAAERDAEEAERALQARLAQERAATEAEAKQRQAFLSSPLGQATAAKEAGLRFFEMQLEVGRHQRDVSWGSRDFEVANQAGSAAELLGNVEALGWRLEHVGYVYMVTGESTTEKFMATGESVAVSGQTVGIYLFRNVDPA